MTKSGVWLSKGKDERPLVSDDQYVYVDVVETVQDSHGCHYHKRRSNAGCKRVCYGLLLTVIFVAVFGLGFCIGSFADNLWKADAHQGEPLEDHLTLNKRHVARKNELKTKPHAKPVLSEDLPTPLSTEYSFDDIYNPDLRPKYFSSSWWEEDILVYQDATRNVFGRDLVNGEEALLIPNTTLELLGTNTYTISPRRMHTYALLAFNIKNIWRHSYLAQYRIYNITSGGFVDFPNSPELANRTLQYAGWCSSSHTLVFVLDNNLYIQPSLKAAPQQVTFTGQEELIFNGIPDWMYEEDVISSRIATVCSPAGSHFVFAEFDDTEVPTQSWPLYGEAGNIYSTRKEIAYPKAGNTTDEELGPITKVSLYAVSTSNVSTMIQLMPPSELASVDHYYTRIAWQDETHAYVVWSNRASNDTFAVLYDVTTGTMQLNNQHSSSNGWVDSPYTEPWFIDGGRRYITILPKTEGTSGTWPHVAVVTAPADSQGEVSFLSSGAQQNVLSIVGVQGNSTVFFTATNGDPTESHLFSVSATGGEEPACLTCDKPETCRYISPSFSGTGSYYIESCWGPGIPSDSLKSIDGNIDEVLEDNADVRARLAEKQLPTREFLEIPLDGGNTDGQAEIFYPANYTEGNQYPLLVYVYGGPNSQRVTKLFPMGSTTSNWLRHLASSYNIIVASLDGRGTTGRGHDYLFQMYRRLGDIEIQDQLTGVEFLKSLPAVDENQKAAVFGWSYGGQCSSQCLAASTDEQFECALSVAPVTTKRYYDSAYTERYMAFDTPSDNQAGYDNTDVIRKASQFQGKSFLLAHGTRDDNVHYMNTANFVKALVEAEVQFRQLMYVDENHSIASPNQSRHLFRAMTDFLLSDCWQS